MNDDLDAILEDGAGLDQPKIEEIGFSSADIGLSVGNGKDILTRPSSKESAISLKEFLQEIYSKLDSYMAESADREFRIIIKFENTAKRLVTEGNPPVSGSYELHEITYKEIEDPKPLPEEDAADKTGAKKKIITVKEEKLAYSSSSDTLPRAISGLTPDPDGRGVLTAAVKRQLQDDKRLYQQTYTLRDNTGRSSETYYRQPPKKPSKI